MNKKFRAWDNYNNEWTIAFLINANGSVIVDMNDNIGIGEVADYKSVNATLEQWTGLTDKNGVKIFEGDIVDGVLYKGYSKHIGRIQYDFSGYRILTKEKSMSLDLPEKLIVIGNIHENKNLLEN